LAERELRGAGALRARGFRLPGRWAEALLVAIAVLVLTGTLMGVFWLGLRMGFVTGTPGGPATRAAAMAIGNSAVDRLEETTIMPPETPGGATTDQELALPEEEQNSTWYTELKALPVFRPAMVEEDWVWDEDRIARVSDPDLSRVASLLTAAYLWKYDFGMEPLRTAGKEEIRNLNMLRIFRYPGVRLDSFETRDDLQGLMGLDLPLVLRVEDRTGHLSPWVVLLEVRGDRAMLADPRLGRISLGLDTLKRVVQAITVIYHDPDSMIALVRGEESEGVSALHRFLTGEGLWEGDGSGEDFDEELGRSLERFQRAYGLEPSGKLDGFTAATIAAMRTAERPRLSPENLDR
ncbi:peptidoglycan-binding protein, partial [bacterium]|nr:peptidoglycan-binding protein [bacterium]